MELVKATPSDVAYLYQVFKAAMQPYIDSDRGHAWDEARERRQFEQELDLKDCWIIESGGHRAGYLDQRCTGRFLLIHTLVVAPEYQGKGIGSQLVRELIVQAAQRELPIILGVLKTNPRARKFYEAHGFQVIAEGARHFQLRREAI